MKVYYEEKNESAKILVIGVGGSGNNAVNHMVRKGLSGACVAGANTDVQDLESCLADIKIPLGESVTRGLGAGADPEIGKMAAEESVDAIKASMQGYDMVFIAAGMGGGTGTGAGPVIAKTARDLGLLTVGIVTKPFNFEGEGRLKKAEDGIRELREHTDALLVISNAKLAETTRSYSIRNAFAMADDILYHAVRSIVDIIRKPGYMNLDFADVRTVMKNGGLSLIGIGEDRGENRALEATKKALRSPLLEGVDSIAGANSVLVNIQSPDGDNELTMEEMESILEMVRQETAKASGATEIILGTVMDRELSEAIRVTVIATGIQHRRGYRSTYRPMGRRPRPTSRTIEKGPETSGGGESDLYGGMDFKRPTIDLSDEEDWEDWQGSGSRA